MNATSGVDYLYLCILSSAVSSSKDFLHSITDPGTHVPTYFCNYAKKGSGIVLSRHREFHPFFFSCSRIWAVKVQGDFINMQNFQAGDLFIAYREENSGKHVSRLSLSLLLYNIYWRKHKFFDKDPLVES